MNERKRNKEWDTENDKKGEEKNEKKKKVKKRKKKRKTARVSGRYYVDYLGLNRGDASWRWWPHPGVSLFVPLALYTRGAPRMPVITEDAVQANRGRKCGTAVTVLPRGTYKKKNAFEWTERKMGSDSLNQQQIWPSGTRWRTAATTSSTAAATSSIAALRTHIKTDFSIAQTTPQSRTLSIQDEESGRTLGALLMMSLGRKNGLMYIQGLCGWGRPLNAVAEHKTLGINSGCRWALEWRLLAAVSADLLFYDGLEHVPYIGGGRNKK